MPLPAARLLMSAIWIFVLTLTPWSPRNQFRKIADFWLKSSFSRVAILPIVITNAEPDGANAVMYYLGKKQIILCVVAMWVIIQKLAN